MSEIADPGTTIDVIDVVAQIASPTGVLQSNTAVFSLTAAAVTGAIGYRWYVDGASNPYADTSTPACSVPLDLTTTHSVSVTAYDSSGESQPSILLLGAYNRGVISRPRVDTATLQAAGDSILLQCTVNSPPLVPASGASASDFKVYSPDGTLQVTSITVYSSSIVLHLSYPVKSAVPLTIEYAKQTILDSASVAVSLMTLYRLTVDNQSAA